MLHPEAMDPSAEALDTAEPQLEAASPGLGISDGIALVVLFVGVSMIPTLLSSLLHRTVGYSIGRGWQVVMVELLAGATLIPLGLRWAGLRFREACPLPPYPARLLPGIALASISLAIVLGELESWLPGVQKFGDLIRQVMGSSGMLPAVLASCIAAPVVEELLCRGVMLRGLRVRRTAGAAILASALLFAAMHLNPWQGFIALPLGLAYGWLTLRTGSLLSSMLAHTLHNTLAAVFVVPALHRLARTGHVTHMPEAVVIPAALAAAAGCALVWWQLRRSPAAVDDAPQPASPGRSGARRLAASVAATAALFVVAVAATMWSGELNAGAAGDRRPSFAETYRLSGCYRLKLPGDVATRLLPGAASTVSMRLTMRRFPGAANEYFVETIGSAPGPGSAIYWIPQAAGEIRVIAPEQGAVLRLRRQAEDLSGEARTYAAGTGKASSAGMARGRRIACPD